MVELAIENLEALPAAWVRESFGAAIPISVYDRYRLLQSLAELGRFAEGAQYEAEMLELAAPMHHAYTVGMAHEVASRFRLLRGDWVQARSLIEHGIAAYRAGSSFLTLTQAVASSAWILAQVGEEGEVLTRLRGASSSSDVRRRRESSSTRTGPTTHWVVPLCCSAGWTTRGAWPTARSSALRLSPGSQPICRTCSATSRPTPTASMPSAAEAHYRRALALAEPRGMRPLIAHCHLGLGKLYRRTDKREHAREHLTTAVTMYHEMDMRFWLERAEAAMREPATHGPRA